MIHEVGNIELCARDGTQSTVQGMFIILGHWHRLLHVRALLAKRKEGSINNSSVVRRTSFPFLTTFLKKGRPHGHRYGKKPGDKEYNIANQLKKKCKKKNFQGIHDRFVRDEQFRSRMIEIGRTEDLCLQMDDLADEDHTHHLTPQYYYNYKSNWWIRSNNIGSDTMPIRHI